MRKLSQLFCLVLAIGILMFVSQGCVTTDAASSLPVGPWQQDIRGLAAHVQADEGFWKQPDAQEPVDWTSRVWDVTRQKSGDKSEDICIWLEVPYNKQQTRAGLWPVPVQVLIPAGSSLATKVDGLALRRGQRVHVKGVFKGFIHTGLDYSQPGKVTAFGQANDMASLMGMLSKVTASNPLQETAELYGKSKKLPLGCTSAQRIILPNMEVKAEEIERAD